jgi:CheY-like chemotaxis protein
VRYTEQGGIRIRAGVRKENKGRVTVRCEVTDTGIGIPHEMQDKVFDRFTQVDSSTSRRHGGTGLGLTITRELVMLMQGRIGLESEVGKGTTFWYEIPLDIAFETSTETVAKDRAPGSSPNWSGSGSVPAADARVLIAEDHELNRAFMLRLLERIGFANYVFVENGRDAVAEVRQHKFDLVLMDCHMPEMDGYMATKAIRSLPDPGRNNIPIIAMTANAMPGAEEQCLAVGMNAYISKPFEIGTFKRILSPWVQFGKDGYKEKVSQEEKDTPAKLEMLVGNRIDDRNYVKEMVEMFISSGDKLLAEMQEVSGKKNANRRLWTEAAHGFMGVAGIAGAKKLHALCKTAEMMGNASCGEYAAVYNEIDGEYGTVKNFLLKEMVD